LTAYFVRINAFLWESHIFAATSMKKTEFFEHHIAAGARMIEFAGYEMPVSYEGVKAEHQAVRQAAGLFDVSHMGQFLIENENALDLIQYVTSNDASKLRPGRAQYSCLPNKNGGIVDDLLIYCLPDNQYLLVVNAANIEKDFNWIEQHNTFGADLSNVSDEWSLLALQGPTAEKELQKLTEVDLAKIKYYRFKKGTVAGVEDVIISATGYTGERGFELYFKVGQADAIWKGLNELDIQLCGLAARDTLRLEKGYALYGNDIDDDTSPLEAGLGWITKTSKANFISKEYFSQQEQNGVSKKLMAFKMLERGIPRKGYSICDPDGKTIGTVTSGTQSPTLEKGIGMGYIQTDQATIGEKIQIGVRNKQLSAEICELPFV